MSPTQTTTLAPTTHRATTAGLYPPSTPSKNGVPGKTEDVFGTRTPWIEPSLEDVLAGPTKLPAAGVLASHWAAFRTAMGITPGSQADVQGQLIGLYWVAVYEHELLKAPNPGAVFAIADQLDREAIAEMGQLFGRIAPGLPEPIRVAMARQVFDDPDGVASASQAILKADAAPSVDTFDIGEEDGDSDANEDPDLAEFERELRALQHNTDARAYTGDVDVLTRELLQPAGVT